LRDIRGDLQDRADWLARQIKTAQEQFEKQCEELEREQGRKLADLEAQLDAVKRLLAVATWHQNVRSVMAAAVNAATVAADVTRAACRSSPPDPKKDPSPAE
jgi:hypothetical protein